MADKTIGMETRRFKVNSSILRMTSKVFETMLGPHFAEGQGLLTRTIPLHEVKLQDDDPKFMDIILNIIHHQNGKIPPRLDCDDLVEMATLIDKYFVHQALLLTVSKWLIPPQTSNLHDFSQAAVILGHAESFREITRLMLLHHVISVRREAFPNQDARLLYFTIDKKRDMYRRDLLRAMYGVINKHSGAYSCNKTQHLTNTYLTAIHALDRRTISLQNIPLQEARLQASPTFDRQISILSTYYCSGLGHEHADPPDVHRKFVRDLDIVDRLCLGCEEREYNGDTAGPCKYGHVASA